MTCYCKIICISYKDHVTNEEVRAKIQQAIRRGEYLVTIVTNRKLKWHGHVFRSSGLAKTILEGTVKGERRQGRQKKKVGRQHQGMHRPGVRRVPEGSDEYRKWRKLVVESSVVPQRPSRSRNRWSEDSEVTCSTLLQLICLVISHRAQLPVWRFCSEPTSPPLFCNALARAAATLRDFSCGLSIVAFCLAEGAKVISNPKPSMLRSLQFVIVSLPLLCDGSHYKRARRIEEPWSKLI